MHNPSELAVTRVRHPLRFRLLQVRQVAALTPYQLRVTLTGDDLHDFESASFDDHVKVFFPEPGAEGRESAPSGIGGYVVVDTQTMSWQPQEPIKKLSEVPPCWGTATPLEPYPQSGPGYRIAAGLLEVAGRLPAALSSRLVPAFEALVRPLPAYVYRVPSSCLPARAPRGPT